MIEINELRIGNWVNCPYENGNFNAQVIELRHGGGAKVKDGSCTPTYRLEFFNPIPLTPEILEKAGFEMEDNNWLNVSAKGVKINFEVDMGGSEKEEWEPNKISGRYLLNDEWLDSKILYVHQLQNLFFALTGEELEIKL